MANRPAFVALPSISIPVAQREENDGDDIEVTPEMALAGMAKLYEFPIMDPCDQSMQEAAAAVFRAMILARSPRDQ